jgi:hypothetical protein
MCVKFVDAVVKIPMDVESQYWHQLKTRCRNLQPQTVSHPVIKLKDALSLFGATAAIQ